MFKKRVFLRILAVIFFSLILLHTTAMASDVQVYVNGQDFSTQLKPVSIRGNILVKARSFAEAINAEITWYQAIKSLSLSRNNQLIKMMVDNPYIQINNRTIRAGTGIKIINGSTYLPLKEVAEGFGFLSSSQAGKLYIFKPEHMIQEIGWSDHGQKLIIKMNKVAPYRINETEDAKKLLLEIDKAALSPDFTDGVSNENYNLKISKAANQARLQISISSKYPIPFQRDGGIEEDGNNLVIKFLPYLKQVTWNDDHTLRIEANGEITWPEISFLQKPRRMVLDFPSLTQGDFELNLAENDWIKDIRISQFKYDPVVLRIVLELKDDRYLYPVKTGNSKLLYLKPTQQTIISNLTFKEDQILFDTSSKVTPDFFTLQNPDRLVINLLNTQRAENLAGKIDVHQGLVEKIRSARFDEETVRIVADLKELTGYNWQQIEGTNDSYHHIITLKNIIKEVIVQDQPYYTNLNLNFSGHVDYQIKKFSYPHRLVVDINGAVTKEELKLPEPAGLVKDIRVNSYKNEGADFLRVVFELSDFNGYDILPAGSSGVINVALAKEKVKEQNNLIVIDAGHGGFDPGAVGQSGLREKDVNLGIALQVRRILEEKGYSVLMTRDTDNFISLQDRVEMANQAEARIFVSIHINSVNRGFSEGTETYLAPEKRGDSYLLAEKIQQELTEELKLYDRGIKEDNFYVIRYTKMPAVLIEVAFISNPHEETLLASDLFKKRAAEAVTRGIISYFDTFKKGDDKVGQ